MVITVQDDVDATVHGVKKTRQYVLHSAQLHSGTVHVGDNVTLLVDKVLSSTANTNCSSALTRTTTMLYSISNNFIFTVSARQRRTVLCSSKFFFLCAHDNS